jgi:hypothetical protein
MILFGSKKPQQLNYTNLNSELLTSKPKVILLNCDLEVLVTYHRTPY